MQRDNIEHGKSLISIKDFPCSKIIEEMSFPIVITLIVTFITENRQLYLVNVEWASDLNSESGG